MGMCLSSALAKYTFPAMADTSVLIDMFIVPLLLNSGDKRKLRGQCDAFYLFKFGIDNVT